MLLIGSRALKLRAAHLLTRSPCDFDWVCTREEYNTWFENNSHRLNSTKVYEMPEYNKMIIEGATNCEFEIITPGSSAEILYNLVHADKNSIDTPFGKIPSLDLLFTIKDTHKYKKFNTPNNHFWKNTIDWHMMRSAGAKIRDEYKEFHSLREKETYNYLHPSLNKTKADFFKDDNIEYIFVHDDIHRAVAINDKPAYEYYLKDGSEVQTSKKKFFECSGHIRLSGIVEEAMTLAIERSLVPHVGVWPADFAFKFALSKVCTSITSGYFRQYGFENIFDAIKLFNSSSKNFFDKFKDSVRDGSVHYMPGQEGRWDSNV